MFKENVHERIELQLLGVPFTNYQQMLIPRAMLMIFFYSHDLTVCLVNVLILWRNFILITWRGKSSVSFIYNLQQLHIKCITLYTCAGTSATNCGSPKFCDKKEEGKCQVHIIFINQNIQKVFN